MVRVFLEARQLASLQGAGMAWYRARRVGWCCEHPVSNTLYIDLVRGTKSSNKLWCAHSAPLARALSSCWKGPVPASEARGRWPDVRLLTFCTFLTQRRVRSRDPSSCVSHGLKLSGSLKSCKKHNLMRCYYRLRLGEDEVRNHMQINQGCFG